MNRKVIYKYQVIADQRFTVSMPVDAQILDVQWQGPHPEGDPFMWALIPVGAIEVPRTFRLLPTGDEFVIPDGYTLEHLGTFQMHNGALVFHVFEEVEVQ